MRTRAPLMAKLSDARFMRSILASAGALAVDVCSFLVLLGIGIAAVPAFAAAYSPDILAHWLMSSRAVFQDKVAANGAARTRQKALFVVSALIGLAVTTAIVGLGDRAGGDPSLAKGAAIVISFALTWLIRSQIVFRAGDPAPGQS